MARSSAGASQTRSRGGLDDSFERALLEADADVVVGLDEVGRGALAGPMAVGAVAVARDCGPPPAGVRDSKKLTKARRASLEPSIRAWCAGSGVGWVEACEIDAFGLSAALTTAALRAIRSLALPSAPVLLLDGPRAFLAPGTHYCDDQETQVGPVHARARADDTWVCVAAASILAKVRRDARMEQLSRLHPGFGWERNKGYGSPEHRRALTDLGPTWEHRWSWDLGIAQGSARMGPTRDR